MLQRASKPPFGAHILKNFCGRAEGHSPSPNPSPVGRGVGDTLPHTLQSPLPWHSTLSTVDQSRVFGARPSLPYLLSF